MLCIASRACSTVASSTSPSTRLSPLHVRSFLLPALPAKLRISITSMANRSSRAAAASGARTALDEKDANTGAFVRRDSVWRSWVGEGKDFPAEDGRYHLYVAYACPWANRCLAVRAMKGLEDCIGVSVVHPTWQKTRPGKDEHSGWVFRDPSDPPCTSMEGHGSFSCEGSIPDTVNGAADVRALYEMAGDTEGKYTVPILWDKKTKTIVSNESADIIIMLNGAFNEFAKVPKLDLNPPEMVAAQAEVDKWIYPCINNGVYRCGFATSQGAYEEAMGDLFEGLDRAESILSQQRYIAGGKMTLADVRLFMTLVRFDEVYVVYFKTNTKMIREYPNLYNYVKDMYQTTGMAGTVNMDHIKMHYFTSHPVLNHFSVVPLGRGDKWLQEPHDRARAY
mmetsp:Transcript_59628/g.189739  ORF Transcript_59628/g.189739 Transcript_59628/m.189739 type:complete len:394 (+) Transcript_59628:70-1251(+)